MQIPGNATVTKYHPPDTANEGETRQKQWREKNNNNDKKKKKKKKKNTKKKKKKKKYKKKKKKKKKKIHNTTVEITNTHINHSTHFKNMIKIGNMDLNQPSGISLINQKLATGEKLPLYSISNDVNAIQLWKAFDFISFNVFHAFWNTPKPLVCTGSVTGRLH